MLGVRDHCASRVHCGHESFTLAGQGAWLCTCNQLLQRSRARLGTQLSRAGGRLSWRRVNKARGAGTWPWGRRRRMMIMMGRRRMRRRRMMMMNVPELPVGQRMHRRARGDKCWRTSAITYRGVMSDDTEIQDIVSEQTSSSDLESDEDPYESEDPHTYDFYSGDSALYLYTQKTNQIVYEYHSGRKVARLREPRDLYGVSSNSFFHLPRWPYECQVLKGKIEHIEWDPPVPEPMYKSLGLEREPTCFNPIESKVIYELSEGWKESYFMCSRVGGNRSPLEPVSPRRCEESDNSLVFESRFESGNLQKAIQVGDYDYQLTLRTDLYTDRHTQWYYFRVKNMRAGVPYRFTITNFMKPTSLYSQGMRPLMYSEIDADSRQVGWRRIGDEIKYYRNGSGRGGPSYYSLSWTFTFPHTGDTCYFAHCYPYTYSNLQDYLAQLANNPERSRYCKIRVLCHSLAGNIVYVLTITNPTPATKDPKKKKAIILTARVHPGESNSSWMMKGFLDFILSSGSEAQLLRDSFIFKVVPMLNPDGVIVGNYRCSLSGRDLNRNYKSRLKDSFPSIWFTRNMIRRVMEEREILLYCDLHGHSRKQNVFMYGCKGGDTHLYERIFPLMLSRISPDKFSFSGCKFKVQKSKEGTGRVVMWKMGIRNSYTLEATFCGSSLGQRRGTHFSTKDLESLGHHFCDALLDYCDPEKTKFSSLLSDLEEMVNHHVNHNRRLGLDSESLLEDVLSDLDSSTRGSDSSDSNGPPAHLMELACKVKPRRKILKSKRERNSQRKTSERILIHDLQEEDENRREKPRAVIVERGVSAEAAKLGPVRKLQNLQRASKKNRVSKQQQALLSEDLGAKKLQFSLEPVPIAVNCTSFNHNGNLLVTGAADGVIRLFDMQQHQCAMSWEAHKGEVYSVDFSYDENAVYSIGEDGKFIQWNIHKSGQKVSEYSLPPDATGPFMLSGYSGYKQVQFPRGRLFAFDSEGNYMLTCSGNGGVIYKLNSDGSTLENCLSLGGHRAPVVTVDWSTAVECGTCLTASMDGKIRLTTLLAQK